MNPAGVTATTNVFAYQPTGMTYVGIPQNVGVLQAQTISSGAAYGDPQGGMTIASAGPFRQQKKLNESDSYLSSTSSSGDEGVEEANEENDDGTSLTSSQHMSGGVLSQQMLGGTQAMQFSEKRPPLINYTGNNPNQSSFSSSSSSHISSSKPTSYDLPLSKKVY